MGLFNFLKKKENISRIREYQCDIFTVLLLPFWGPMKIPDEEKGVCFYNSKNNAGALQFWLHSGKEGTSQEEYIKYVEFHMKAKMEVCRAPKGTKILKKINGSYHYYSCEFEAENKYWMLVYVLFKNKMAEISYNCQISQKDINKSDVINMINSLKFIGISK